MKLQDTQGNPSETAVDEPTRWLAPVGYPCGSDHRYDPAELTAVIPKMAPAKPEADWDRPDPPLPCGKKIRAIGLLFGAGVVAGIPIGMVLAFVFIVAKVVA